MTNETRFNQATLDELQTRMIAFYNKGFCDNLAPPTTRQTVATVSVLAQGLLSAFNTRDAMISQGYVASNIEPVLSGSTASNLITFYLRKPQAEQEADIARIKVQVEAEYRVTVEANAQKAAEKEAAEELAAIEAEVQATLAKEQEARIAAIRARILGEKAAVVKRAAK